MADPWTPSFGNEGPSLEAAVLQAIGTASLCWHETPKGEFDPAQATWVGEGLMTFINGEIDRARADEREQIAQAWQWGAWTIITQKVKEREVIAVAQVVTDWLRGRAGGGE